MFNDIDSRTMGIVLEGEVPVQRGRERVTQVTIPGRAGVLTLLEGEDVFESYIQTATIAAKGTGADMRKIESWLRGEGYVTFSSDSTHRQKARIINGVVLTRVSPLLDWYKASIQFYCDPFKEDLAQTSQVLTGAGEVINLGDVIEKPVFVIRGRGDVVLTVNGEDFVIANLTAEQQGCVIDTDAQMVANLNGTQLITTQTTGEFPVLRVGRNEVSFTGADSVVIERRERFL